MPVWTRRHLLQGGGLALGTGLLPVAAATTTGLPTGGGEPSDSAFWQSVAAQYDVTQQVIQLENGNWVMMARPVLAEYQRQQARVNAETSFYARRSFGPDAKRVVERVAGLIGCGLDEITLTRNATEALLALIGGYNRLRPGDTVIYADLDYDAMQAGMASLRQRRGVEVVRIDLPEPATYQGLIDAYAAALTAHPKTRLLLLTHLTHRTGLILPVAEITAMARARGVDVIVDAAHSIGLVEFTADSLGADFVGYNLHKWIGAPVGVGALYIRRGRVPDIDPSPAEMDPAPDNIRARVHTGTRDLAALLAVPAAIDFHQSIGTNRIAARLRHLRDRWAEPLRDHPAYEILTPPDPRLTGGLTSFRRRGVVGEAENAAISRQLLEKYGIFTVHRAGVARGACVRVTPALFNQESDTDKLLAALRHMAG